MDVYQQIFSYAYAVVADERFRNTDTRWVFWAISNEVSGEVQQQTAMKDKPRGLAWEASDGQTQIWVKTWGQVIEDCRSRLRFFQQALEYEASDESALGYLRRLHGEYLPPALVGNKMSSTEAQDRQIKMEKKSPRRRSVSGSEGIAAGPLEGVNESGPTAD